MSEKLNYKMEHVEKNSSTNIDNQQKEIQKNFSKINAEEIIDSLINKVFVTEDLRLMMDDLVENVLNL